MIENIAFYILVKIFHEFIDLNQIAWKSISWRANSTERYAELILSPLAYSGQTASLSTNSTIGPSAPTCALEFDYLLTGNVNSSLSFAIYLFYLGSGAPFPNVNIK